MKSTKRSVIGGLTRSLQRREARPFDAQPFLLFCRRDSGPRVQVQAQLHSPVAQGSNLKQGGILENRITFFRGILYHCARDVIFFLFPRRALVRSRLVRELLRLARGHLQAGGQRPLTLPRGNRRGAGAHFLFLRLILLKQILDKEIKKNSFFSASPTRLARHPTLRWRTSPSRLAKMHGARGIWRKANVYPKASLLLCFSLAFPLSIFATNGRQWGDFNRKSIQVQTCRGCARYRSPWAAQLHAIVLMLLVLYGNLFD